MGARNKKKTWFKPPCRDPEIKSRTAGTRVIENIATC